MIGADVFLGLSKKDVLTQSMIRSMANRPIVFALVNPDPEISYEEAKAHRKVALRVETTLRFEVAL